MTLQEFKAWFEGFTEAMKGPPSAKAWERIKRRVGEIDGTVTTQKVFVERYWPSLPYNPYIYPICNSGGTLYNTDTTIKGPIYTSNTAMYTLGQGDWVSLTSGTAG